MLAGCLTPPADEDGRSQVRLINVGPPAFASLVGESGVAWSGRLLTRETRVVDVPVRVGGCADYTLYAGFDGEEPDTPVRLVAPCDGDARPTRLEFAPPPRRN